MKDHVNLLQILYISEAVQHENLDIGTYTNDICLLKLVDPIQFNE